MSTKNKHGLSRSIGSEVKRLIRQQCGFGCVICCSSIWDYEHIDPTFENATWHDAAAMALLCPNHHREVTSGRISKETVASYRKSPCSLNRGEVGSNFDLGAKTPSLQFGGLHIQGCPIPIKVGPDPLFEVKGGEELGSPFRLSGNFYNSKGKLSLKITDNEWKVFSNEVWDLDIKGPVITIRDEKKNISLCLKMDPPNGIIIEKLNMTLKNYTFIGGKDSLSIFRDGNNIGGFKNCLIKNCGVGMNL